MSIYKYIHILFGCRYVVLVMDNKGSSNGFLLLFGGMTGNM
jgi:hypothetical protein